MGENTSLIIGVNAVSLGLMEAPGNYGADIVVGEGQPFGIGPTGVDQYTEYLPVKKILFGKCPVEL